jgi:putative Mg2+ transporter-C (MgtC) family protein
MIDFESLSSFWARPDIAANITLLMDMLFALVLGLIFGYERSYHGRAAGMRTYGLVCMVSAALIAISGYSRQWFGGAVLGIGPVDPTRVVQGIVTGIGFLGAGIIMKDGLNISGLTTAASIWAASAIGVLVGLGFYVDAVGLTLLAVMFIMWGAKIGSFLPSRHPLAVVLQFRKGFLPSEEAIRKIALEHGYEIAQGSIAIQYRDRQVEWRFVAISLGKAREVPLAVLAKELPMLDGVESFQLSHARN